MTELLDKLARDIRESEGFSDAANSLFEAYVFDLVGESRKLERESIKNLLFSAQVFSNSSEHELKSEGAILLSMSLDVAATEFPDIIPIADYLFTQSGNFPNLNLLERRHPDTRFQRGILASAQSEFRTELNSVDELNFPLTDYQRVLWEDLAADRDMITSAPTSAGKTHIILHYLLEKIANSDGAFAAVVVPTRALISEVAGKIHELAAEAGYGDELEICTVSKEGEFKDKTFFVMTQERLHETLLRGDIRFNYFFLDEAHNIADQSRGVLLHITIEKLLENSAPQIIVSMPSDRYQNSFATIFDGIEFKKQITSSSPVSKIIMSVVPKGRSLSISKYGSDREILLPKNFLGKNLADIVFRLGQKSSNIIYRNQTNHCEDFADRIASLIEDDDSDERLFEAANYIEEYVHEEFTLARNLRKGVAFHYGPLPSSVRVMIENLVKDDAIKFIACTSTLAEGINLPAKNLFLKNPTQPSSIGEANTRLDDVKINNITGRAGRMLEHFAGNIFLVEPEDWTYQDYFEDSAEDDDKIPTYFSSLNHELDSVLRALSGQVDPEENNRYRFYTIANKLIKEFDDNSLANTLDAKELRLSERNIGRLVDAIETASSNLRVPTFTLEANPTVGYIQQNSLFTRLSNIGDFSEWLLPHPRSSALYPTLLRVCELLYECGIYSPTDNNSIGHVCTIARKWIQEKSLKEMIIEQIAWDARNPQRSRSVNTSVRNVIKVINNDVRFRLSNALRCYNDLLATMLRNKDIENSSVKLHAYMETGATSDLAVSLVALGISREAAIQIQDLIPENPPIDSSADVERLVNSGALDDLHPVTKKEIARLLDF
ncbi:MAG: DEAD/DEAH box helicase [Henriciella sp.]